MKSWSVILWMLGGVMSRPVRGARIEMELENIADGIVASRPVRGARIEIAVRYRHCHFRGVAPRKGRED